MAGVWEWAGDRVQALKVRADDYLNAHGFAFRDRRPLLHLMHPTNAIQASRRCSLVYSHLLTSLSTLSLIEYSWKEGA
jgi:hypothetical protein